MGKCNFGIESVKRQSLDLFEGITDSVSKIRKSGDFSTSSVKKSYLAQVIKENTGLNVVTTIVDGWQAAIRLPPLSPNHVFSYVPIGSASPAIIDITKTSMKGTVDPANVMVTGVFSDIKSTLEIGTALFKPDGMTDEMIAAIILHELGHVFTYFQFLTTIAYGGLVVQQTVRNVFMAKDYQTKRIQIKMAEDILGLEMEPGIEEWVDTSKDNLEVILMTRYFRQLNTRTDSIYYDVRNAEQLADTFAVRHGAGVYLAKANHKLNKANNQYGNRNYFVHLLSETANTIKQFTYGEDSIREILLTVKQPTKYDNPKDRIAFIRFQLIDDLKQLPRGDKAARESIVSSIKDIDKILKSIKQRKTFLTYVHETFSSAGRANSKSVNNIKKLESMLYNDLYYQSAKLKTLH